jgi:hypothetical protein
MKLKIIIPLLCIQFLGFAQKSEDIIPQDAVIVFSLNNMSLLHKVPMDDLVSYDFMTELQSELFDGSTQGKTLKDSGIDFNQKLNIFYGRNPYFELSGFTFGINDKNKLFDVFDDFDRKESLVPGTEYYNNYFNHLIIKGNNALLIRVDSDQDKLSEITDSIWTARGFELPWVNEFDDQFMDEDSINNGEYSDEDVSYEPLPEADSVSNDIYQNYYELRDSLEYEFSHQRLQLIVEEIFLKNQNLKAMYPRFAAQLTHTSDGIFYSDNSRNVKNSESFFSLQSLFPSLYNDINKLYTGNIMLGDIVLNEKSVDLKIEANYGEELGSIYKQLNSAKFDKNVLKYIPQSNAGFFTYQIDLNEGYKRAYDVIIPMLDEVEDLRVSTNVLTIELFHDFVNTDELFNTYKGSMFGTFNGIKHVKTKRIEFSYDEETFEYLEKEIEGEEDMPIFTLGFSTARPDVPAKILRHLARITSQFKDMGDYWVYEDAILNSVPMYMINKNGLFIFTNDEDLAKNHSNGYGAASLTSKQAKNAMKSGSIYSYVNLGETVDRIPEAMLDESKFNFITSLKGKKGELELISSKTTTQKTTYDLTYRFDTNLENAGKYLLDLVNTAYLLSTNR